MNYWIVDTDEGFYSMCIGAFNEEGGNPGTPCVTGVVCAGDNGNVGAMKLQAEKISTVLSLGRDVVNYIHPDCDSPDPDSPDPDGYQRHLNTWLRPELRVTDRPTHYPSVMPSMYSLIVNGQFHYDNTNGWEQVSGCPRPVTDATFSAEYALKIPRRGTRFQAIR
eukprot:UN03209